MDVTDAEKREIRQRAWQEYQDRILRGYTQEQQLCFMAGMAVMWRLCKFENSPLFTYGPDSLPKEIK